jgi:hypothetical protein
VAKGENLKRAHEGKVRTKIGNSNWNDDPNAAAFSSHRHVVAALHTPGARFGLKIELSHYHGISRSPGHRRP